MKNILNKFDRLLFLDEEEIEISKLTDRNIKVVFVLLSFIAVALIFLSMLLMGWL